MLAVGAAVLGGCQSPEERIFTSARLGDLWAEVPNADLYWPHNPHSGHQEGPGDGNGTYYWVATGDDGRIVAKATERIKGTSTRSLTTDAKSLSELAEIEKNYPFASTKPSIPGPISVTIEIWDYPPLARPLSDEDRVLPSGTRQSTWAKLANSLEGWPFAKQNRPLLAWLDGQEIPWDALVTQLEQGKLRGTIVLTERQE